MGPYYIPVVPQDDWKILQNRPSPFLLYIAYGVLFSFEWIARKQLHKLTLTYTVSVESMFMPGTGINKSTQDFLVIYFVWKFVQQLPYSHEASGRPTEQTIKIKYEDSHNHGPPPSQGTGVGQFCFVIMHIFFRMFWLLHFLMSTFSGRFDPRSLYSATRNHMYFSHDSHLMQYQTWTRWT